MSDKKSIDVEQSLHGAFEPMPERDSGAGFIVQAKMSGSRRVTSSTYSRPRPIQRKGHSDQTGDLPRHSVGSWNRLSGTVQLSGMAERKSYIQEAAQLGTAGHGSAIPFKAEMEEKLNTCFDDVQAFTDSTAQETCKNIGANAYTSNNRIAFSSPNPDRSLVAHELAHVVQQRQGVQLDGGVGDVGDPYERNADAVADAVRIGRSAAHLLGTYIDEPKKKSKL